MSPICVKSFRAAVASTMRQGLDGNMGAVADVAALFTEWHTELHMADPENADLEIIDSMRADLDRFFYMADNGAAFRVYPEGHTPPCEYTAFIERFERGDDLTEYPDHDSSPYPFHNIPADVRAEYPEEVAAENAINMASGAIKAPC